MMDDPTLSDNVQNDRGERYDAQPYYEYGPSTQYQGVMPPQPVSPLLWPVPGTPPVAPWAPEQMVVPPPWLPQPPSVPPAYQPAAQGVMPPPMAPPSRAARSSKKRRWIFGIIGVVCAIMVVLASGYALLTNLAGLSHKSTPPPTSVKIRFQTAACPFTPGDGITEGKELTCGYLTVPEDRGNAQSRAIQLAVAIFKPSATVPSDPVVYLSGGPGGALLSGWGTYVSTLTLDQMTQGHTLIMFDQRGTGYSQPALNCSEIDQLNKDTQDKILGRDEGNAQYVAAAKKCHDRLVNADVNLQAYTSIADADDVHDLIQALGYKQVDLYGVSYGTRLALTVMRLFPADIRSVILDSTLPTQINTFKTFPAVTQHAYDTLFQGCAASPRCHAKYPQLESVFYKLVDDVNAKPITFQDVHYGPVALDGDGLANWVFSMMYVTQLIPVLPEAIMQISQGNYEILSQYFGILMLQNDISYGMYYSVECGEDIAFTTADELSKATAGIHREIQPEMNAGLKSDVGICQFWGDQPVPTAQKQAVTSSLPTLILSGEYDPITPLSNAQLALQTLSHGYLFKFPGTGHGVFNTDFCPDSIVAAFLRQPVTRPSDSCIATMLEPDFQ
jgi:pimeloyl-ACP methyl ester carboxylesterase